MLAVLQLRDGRRIRVLDRVDVALLLMHGAVATAPVDGGAHGRDEATARVLRPVRRHVVALEGEELLGQLDEPIDVLDAERHGRVADQPQRIDPTRRPAQLDAHAAVRGGGEREPTVGERQVGRSGDPPRRVGAGSLQSGDIRPRRRQAPRPEARFQPALVERHVAARREHAERAGPAGEAGVEGEGEGPAPWGVSHRRVGPAPG